MVFARTTMSPTYTGKSFEDSLRERIQMALVEELNRNSRALQEPEQYIPVFIEQATNRLLEITMDEITFRRRY